MLAKLLEAHHLVHYVVQGQTGAPYSIVIEFFRDDQGDGPIHVQDSDEEVDVVNGIAPWIHRLSPPHCQAGLWVLSEWQR